MRKDVLAKQFLQTIPRVMTSIRCEMREAASSDLTVPQFRILAHLSIKGQAINAEIAEFLGVSAPGACRMINFLLKRGFVKQARDESDRRQVFVELTPAGRRKFNSIRSKAQSRFEKEFSGLSESQREALIQGLHVMEEVFKPHTKARQL